MEELSYKDVILGAEKDPKDSRDYLACNSSYLLETKETPPEIDWEPEMSPVKNQGPLGSCVAFSVCAIKEWQEKKEHKLEVNKNKEYDLSEQWLYYKCKEIDSWPNTQGTSFRFAMNILQKQGIPVESGWNYDPITKGAPEKWAIYVANWYKCASYWRITTLEQLKILLSKGPIVIGITCFDEIFKPIDGIVPMPKNRKKPRGGHAITVCGFEDTKQLIKFKNSWGISWGNQGYGYLSYDYYNAYCLDAWYFEDVNFQTTTTRPPSENNVQVIKEERVVMQKVKLINKLNQLLYIHVIRNGRDTAVPIVAKGMIGITTSELEQSPDIRDKIARGFLEKK